jgi:transposase
MVVMSAEEIRTIGIIGDVQSGRLTQEQASVLLQVSERSIRRYLKEFELEGPLFVKHKNTGKAPANRLPEELKSAMQNLIREKYFDLNVLHIQEKLYEKHGILVKRETLRTWCHELRLVKRTHKRRAQPRHYRDRMPQEGLMVQLDGSLHRWFGESKAVLIATIDDATGTIPYAEFFPKETTWACLRVLQRILEKKGIPHSLYVDRAGIYGGNSKRENFSQLHRACEDLGIHVIYAYSPQAKGRIERLFQTLQDRLVPELRLAGAKNYFEANFFLQRSFIPHFNDRFGKAPENSTPAWKALPSSIDLREVLCFKEHRLIHQDHTLSVNRCYWRIMNPLTHSLARYYAEVRTYQDGSWAAFWNDMQLTLHPTRKIHRPPSAMPNSWTKSLGN